MKNYNLYKKVILVLCLFVFQVKAYEVAELKHSENFIFSEVLRLMNITPNSQIEMPKIILQHKASLKEFQQDVLPQWGFLPDSITNVYIFLKNKIYLLDEKNYYQSMQRCIDDSLAHEYVHFVQVKYQNIPLEYFDDGMEFQAVDIQTKFRDLNCKL